MLLVRSLKLIHKQDMLDIGALSDLRSYLNAQETVCPQHSINSRLILTSSRRYVTFSSMSSIATFIYDHFGVNLAGLSMNLDNKHVSLQWKFTLLAHIFLVQEVFDEEGKPHESIKHSIPVSPITPSSKPTRLSRYLDDLNIRANEPPYDLKEQSFSDGAPSMTLQTSASISLGLSSAPSRSSLPIPPGTLSSSSGAAQSNRNPEADSFAYMETLLEALAVLGKLGLALDLVAQKLPQEIYTLVEATLDEVSERAEYGRRASMLGSSGGTSVSRQSDIYFQTGSGGISLGSTYLGLRPRAHGVVLPASTLRLGALEMSTKRVDQEVMKDFFWTLYSKLDAVAQGLRVIYEVSNRIGSVGHSFRSESCVVLMVATEERLQRYVWYQTRIVVSSGGNLDAYRSGGA